jgi:hypothetical protein
VPDRTAPGGMRFGAPIPKWAPAAEDSRGIQNRGKQTGPSMALPVKKASAPGQSGPRWNRGFDEPTP